MNIPAGKMLSIQAYERLVTFAERCGFHSLTERLAPGNLDALALANVYKDSIRAEYEHNLSQQIYVTEAIWQAVTALKEQQVFIVERILEALPAHASGIMLAAALKTFLEADPMASMQPKVLEALRAEARNNLTSI